MVDRYIGALCPPELLQTADECSFTKLPFRIALIDRLEHADAPYPVGLLRARRNRPRNRGAAGHAIVMAKTSTFKGRERP
jgi:hypothetical protein